MRTVFVVMGVSGSGKSTVGAALAQRLNCPFLDGDSFHPPENIAKMSSGIPLNDVDRTPWLEQLNHTIGRFLAQNQSAVFACSALKKSYRDLLRHGNNGLTFIHLTGDYDLIWQRMMTREGHFMSATLLQSQFDTLEMPVSADVITVSIQHPVQDIVNQLTIN